MSETVRVINLLEGVAEKAIRGIALEVTDRLIATTPVATGWARSNWIPSIGQSVDSPDGTRESFDGSQQAQGRATLSAYQLKHGRIFVSNNVPYITKLNAGSSPKAPAGFVQSAADQAVSAIEAQL